MPIVFIVLGVAIVLGFLVVWGIVVFLMRKEEPPSVERGFLDSPPNGDPDGGSERRG